MTNTSTVDGRVDGSRGEANASRLAFTGTINSWSRLTNPLTRLQLFWRGREDCDTSHRITTDLDLPIFRNGSGVRQ